MQTQIFSTQLRHGAPINIEYCPRCKRPLEMGECKGCHEAVRLRCEKYLKAIEETN